MLEARMKSCPVSLSHAARWMSRRAAVTRRSISASLNWTAWSRAIGAPHAWRCWASRAASWKAAVITPSACAATPMRPESRLESAILKPSPSAPSRCDTGSRAPSNDRVTVSEPRSPILSSDLPIPSPGGSFSTMNPLIPLGPGPPVRADRVVPGDYDGERRGNARDLMDHVNDGARVVAEPAPLLRDVHAEEPHLGQLFDGRRRDRVVAIPARGLRRELAAAEGAHRIADLDLVFGEVEVHGRPVRELRPADAEGFRGTR